MSTSEPAAIGGELELAVADLSIDPATARPLPSYGAAHERWFDTGRSALAAVAADIVARGGRRTVWIPAYCCESAVAPFRREGFDVRYYAVGAQLRSIEADPRPGETLLFVHYFGHRHRAALTAAAAWRQAGVHLVEDCVQAGLTASVGGHGDYAVNSLRKLLPVPDGALLASRTPIAFQAGPSSEQLVVAKLAGKLLRGARAEDASYLRLFAHAEALLEETGPRRMSWLSEQMLRATELEPVVARRRSNWTYVVAALLRIPALRGLVPLVDALAGGEAPLGLPVRVPRAQRDALRAQLAQRRVFCAVHWPLDHLPAGAFAPERALAAELLTLPIDQRYQPRDLERMLEALQDFPGDLA